MHSWIIRWGSRLSAVALLAAIGWAGTNPATQANADGEFFAYIRGSGYHWIGPCAAVEPPTGVTVAFGVRRPGDSEPVLVGDEVLFAGWTSFYEYDSPDDEPDFQSLKIALESSDPENRYVLLARFGECEFEQDLGRMTLPAGSSITEIEFSASPPVVGEVAPGVFRVGPTYQWYAHMLIYIQGFAPAATVDSDQDGLYDESEVDIGSDPWSLDTDGDGLADVEEMIFGCSPVLVDTDGDGLNDGDEFFGGWSDPGHEDSDLDGLPDGIELANPMLNAWSPDSDGDSLRDGLEGPLHGTDPANPDSDYDALWDNEELLRGTNPLDWDTDDDNMIDGFEVWSSTDPLDPDTDNDGLPDDEWVWWRTDPLRGDSDYDGLGDGDEVHVHGTDPASWNTDADWLSDGDEVLRYGTNPLDYDTDNDGVWDDLEVENGYDPLDKDTDNDGLEDDEQHEYYTDPKRPDTDSDGLTDGQEVLQFGTNPIQPDTDFDGLDDAVEVELGSNPRAVDTDSDGWRDGVDNCPVVSNPGQADFDGDEKGDPCDPDDDGDDVADVTDVCPLVHHAGFDADGNGCGDTFAGFDQFAAAASGIGANARSHILAKAVQARDKLCDKGDVAAALDKLTGLRGFVAENTPSQIDSATSDTLDAYLANLIAQVGSPAVCLAS